MEGLVKDWPRIADSVLGPPRWPRHPFVLARFGLLALRRADRLFGGKRARGLFAGIAALVLFWVTVRFIGPAAGWWTTALSESAGPPQPWSGAGSRARA